MKQNAYVLGVGMTPFGKHLDKGLKELAIEAIDNTLRDAGMDTSDIEAAYMGNAAASVITGQVCIAGQAILRTMGIGAVGTGLRGLGTEPVLNTISGGVTCINWQDRLCPAAADQRQGS